MMDRKNVQVILFVKEASIQILLLKRMKDKGGFWQPISGGVETGEELVDAVKREVYEETGISEIKQILDLKYSFHFEAEKDGQIMQMTDHCFGMEIKEKVCIKLSDEHEKYIWCSVEEAKKHITWEFSIAAIQRLVEAIGH